MTVQSRMGCCYSGLPGAFWGPVQNAAAANEQLPGSRTVDTLWSGAYNRGEMPVRVPDHWLKKLVMRELFKRDIDISRILVFSTAGVVTIMGELRNMRGFQLDLKHELAQIENIIRQIHGVRDIINQVKVVEF